ncbi:hypothetical protein KUTeg_024433 [Tegillarca granosa]|uniref:Uncharacterized protein n=1 Tax=Tegillarca granosa TaxID=220873 RepID=A0ABQ9E1Y3_TEGGR|nr:hypothetical protein KUTeg_024433 [Tegillarca granosa]
MKVVVSQCDFFENWPLEELVEHPEQCLLHFFKRNVVVVKDSTQSEWIYVKTRGSCIVLKQLKGVTARLGRKTKLKSDTKLPKLQMAPAKVDTGLRKRRQVKSAGAEREIEKDLAKQVRVQTPVSDRGAREPEDKHFSKSQYSKFPTTHKAYFGLETIDFDDGIERPKTVVTLVSQGAECVMMSKAFFAKHANEKVKRWIRHQIRPYPIDETFQENLQIKVDWELYKADLINDLTSRI